MITPTLNLNGSGVRDLIDPRLAAYDLLDAAMLELQKVTPHGRDYLGDTDLWAKDLEAHFGRMNQIRIVMIDLMAEAATIQEQDNVRS